MKAAIYARKSTDDNDKNEDNKSVKRQVERANAFAAKHGWTVDEDHVYVDDGISGAEFKNRPALLRLLNSLKQFDVIIMSELSRLGREQSQTSSVLASISSKGVRVYFYLTGEELKFESAVDKFMVSAVSFAAELEREKASQRSRDALERKAQKGYNAGGRVYGYDNVPVMSVSAKGEQTRSHTEYKVNDKEAGVIRSIYRAFADGHGAKTIAKALNGDPRCAARLKRYFSGEKPPSPRTGTGSWAPSSVNSILHNVRYTGVIPYGKHRKKLDLAEGTKKRVKQAEYLKIDAPKLRIVDAKLARAVEERQAQAKKTYLRDTGGRLWGRPGMGAESKYLLTGLARCGCCESNMVVLGRPSAGKRLFYYGCSYHNNRGPTVCANDHRVRMESMNDAVIASIEQQVLSPEIIAYAIEGAAAQVANRLRTNPDRPREIETELKKLRREVANLTRAIAGGRAPKTLVEEIASCETRIEALEKERNGLSAVEPSELDLRRLRKAAEARIGRFRDLLHEDVPLARQALRKLLVEPLKFKPVMEDGHKSYAFEGKTRAGVLLEPFYLEMASPRGFEPLLPP